MLENIDSKTDEILKRKSVFIIASVGEAIYRI